MNKMKRIVSLALTIVIIFGSMDILKVNTYASTKVRKTKITKVTAKSYKKVKVTWKKVKGASGYVVYRKKNAGAWKKLKTVKKNVNYFYDTKVKSNTKYSYKIKVYKKIGKIKYSKFSKVKSVLTPKRKDNIINLNTIDSSMFELKTDIVKDSFGNVYSNTFLPNHLRDNSYIYLYLAEKYNTLNLTIAPTSDRLSYAVTYTYIYADDQMIYSSDAIKKTTTPTVVKLNVKDVDVLKIVESIEPIYDAVGYHITTIYSGYVSE